MKITVASVLLCAWIVTLLAALVGAIWTCARKGRGGIIPRLELLLGTLFLFGFVSGVIGLYEMNDYMQSLPFWISMALGLGGLTLIGLGIRGVRSSSSRKTSLETS